MGLGGGGEGSHPLEEFQLFSGGSVFQMSPWICRESGCVPASHQLSFVPKNITKCLYHSVLDTQSQVTYTTLGRFLVLFLTTQSPLSAWIKNAALGCSGGRCLHVSCALLCRKFAKKKIM